MSQSDVVEMEDNGSGNKLDDSKTEVLDVTVESEGKKSPCAGTVSEDVNENADGGKDANKCGTDVTKAELSTKVKDQNDPETEADKPIVGSVSGEVNIGTEAEEKTTVSTVENKTDAINEVLEQKATNGGIEEGNSFENGMEGENHGNNVEKTPNENVENTGYDEHIAGGELTKENADVGQLPTELSANKDCQRQDVDLDGVLQGEDEGTEDAVNFKEDKIVKGKEQGEGTILASRETDGNETIDETTAEHDSEESSLANQHEAATPNALFRCSSLKAADHSGDITKTIFTQATLPPTEEGDDGTPDDQTAFMKELESFYRERAMDFKPPKFYGQPLNCLKLWRAVIRLGGYDKVTGSKLWRQVGESFHPPKTCTTVSWTFRIFYEKSLLEYERHKTQSGEVQLPIAMLPEVSGVDGEGNVYQVSGSGRARRDAAARAMQGWHAQRISTSGEVGEPIIKDKNLNSTAKNEKNLKSIGSLKQKRPNEVEQSSKTARTEMSRQLAVSVVDIGPPADWVKINVLQTKECFEIYTLVPGLLREEVRVQSDPAGRVVITGQPEQVDNPWGITPFKKVVSLPARIDPLHTSAVVSLHGRLFVRVPFEQSNI